LRLHGTGQKQQAKEVAIFFTGTIQIYNRFYFSAAVNIRLLFPLSTDVATAIPR
jgi:hypothetical protein